ncbi:MAG: TonB-dependent receptor [Gracilimonas sp.]|uniref:TonB-dependent receptor plug domain-containing protein n=1 Tax=Gracilimonas sp. TaxID=1974203 RepID=UPI00199F03C7|nr:TonB-dependent receptor [Gracilimonas sp.]MBD3616550.1 TonB-dependent receptor [Gracilimonas sp.]
MRYLLTLLLLFLLIESPKAQIKAELDSIDVTASRITTSISESGKNVSVITAEQIGEMPVQSVDELLRSLPGININGRAGFGVQADVGVRGSTFSQVMFLLDNTPLNDPLTAHFNTNIPVALSEIAQIELIRGPASTSFGADAVGGVVHIKTKAYMMKEVEAPEEFQPRANLDVSAGENDLRIIDATAGVAKKNIRFSTSFRTASSDGEQFSNPGFEQGVSPEENYNTYFDMMNLSAALSVNLAENWNWYVRSGIENRDFNARYFYTRSIYDESVEKIDSRWALSALTYDNGNHRTEINASYRDVEDVFDFNSGTLGIPPNEHQTQQLFLNASHQYELNNDQLNSVSESLNYMRFMIGGQILNKQIESTDRGDHENTSWGVYGIHTMNYGFGLSVTTSLRLQFNPISDLSFLPQISAAYDMGTLNIRTSIGQALREGDFTERYISHEIPNLTPGRNIGNPDLLPEESTTFDLGLDWTPTNNLRISPTAFYRSSSNLIDYALTNSNNIDNADNLQDGEEYFYASNISESDVVGIEFLSALTSDLGSSVALRTEAGYTYIKTTSDQNTVSRYIANHPSHQVSLDLSLTGGNLSVQSQSQFNVRSEEAEALINAEVPNQYFLTNLKVGYKPFGNNFQIYTQILNVTDTQYQEILGAPMPGRWVLGGVKYSL